MTKKILGAFVVIVMLSACAPAGPEGAVQGKRYVGNSADECARIRFICEKGSAYFSDEKGCGCQTAVLASIDSVDVLIMESFPVQVSVLAKGSLKNGCERVGEIEKSVDQLTITIPVVASGDVCTQALVPFEQRIPLSVAGWKKGEYKVSVNGVEKSFTLETDNVLNP